MRISKNKEERRQELIDAAERLFLENGYTGTSVNDIVRTTGVAQGTFYYHFKSKEDILEAIVHKTVQTLEVQLREIVEKTGIHPARQLQELLAALFEFVLAHRSLITFVHLDSNALLHHRLMGTTARIIQRHLLTLVERGIKEGCFHVSNPEDAINFFLGGVTGVLHVPSLSEDPVQLQRFRATAEIALTRILGQTEVFTP